MGLVLMLRSPRPRLKSPRRATRTQRREHRRAEAEEWETARQRGRLLEVAVEDLLPLVNSAGGSGLRILGQLDPWSDTVLDRRDLPRLEADVDRLEAVAVNDAQRKVVTAVRELLTRWRAEHDLVLHCYGE